MLTNGRQKQSGYGLTASRTGTSIDKSLNQSRSSRKNPFAVISQNFVEEEPEAFARKASRSKSRKQKGLTAQRKSKDMLVVEEKLEKEVVSPTLGVAPSQKRTESRMKSRGGSLSSSGKKTPQISALQRHVSKVLSGNADPNVGTFSGHDQVVEVCEDKSSMLVLQEYSAKPTIKIGAHLVTSGNVYPLTPNSMFHTPMKVEEALKSTQPSRNVSPMIATPATTVHSRLTASKNMRSERL